MWYQVVNDAANEEHSLNNAKGLFLHANPLVITAFIEDAWRQTGNNETFPAWPETFTQLLKEEFNDKFRVKYGHKFGTARGGRLMPHHLIYAYFIGSTGIDKIFRKVHETYIAGEDRLDAPARSTQQFWRNTEYVAYSNPLPTTVWNLLGTTRPDEAPLRSSVYYRMFGADILQFDGNSESVGYQKPELANVDFFPTFELFLGQVWRGIANRKNTTGRDDTSISAIAQLASKLNHQLLTRQQNGNLSREAFRAVLVMEWFDTAIRFPSVVSELLASGTGREMTLSKIAARVDMEANPKSKQLFEIAPRCSALLKGIEAGIFNECTGAQFLLHDPNLYCLVDEVITLYEIIFNRDLRTAPLSLSDKSAGYQAPAIMQRHAPVVRQLAVAQTNR
jgi:hypothetical protein